MGARENLETACKVFQHWMKPAGQASNLSYSFFGKFLFLDSGNPITSLKDMQIPWWFAHIRTQIFSVSIQIFALVLPVPNETPSPPLLNDYIKWDHVNEKGLGKYKSMNTGRLIQKHPESQALLLFLSVIEYLWICTRCHKVRVRTMRPNPSPSKTTDYRFPDKNNTQEVIRNLHRDWVLILNG